MRRLDSLLLAGVGVLAVHQLAYAMATLAGYEMTVSHGHLATAWLLSSLTALVALARSITRSLRRREHQIGGLPSFISAITFGYTILEGVERSLDGVGPASLLGEPVFWLGLLTAPLIAAVLAWSIRSVERLVVAVTKPPSLIRVLSTPPSSLPATSVELPHHITLSFAVSRRGPPAALHL